uniref:Ig-like domain-containing protein n=1 Tax=Neolamprologus brichardi TaxID=32507 RepID=A0A3Q4HCD6_NEOBR
ASRISVLRVCACACMCLCAEECQLSILAKREMYYVPEGGILSLSCVVHHCGNNWTGAWMWENSTYDFRKPVKESERHHLTNKTISASQTKLFLNIQSVNQSDEGSYGCMVVWDTGVSENGHRTHVNITAGPSPRKLLHRVLICACALLCLPIILELARCLSSEVKPQPLPRAQVIYEVPYPAQQTISAPQPPPRCPVMYAVISQGALKQQGATRQPAHSATVYSSLKFDNH